jgi:hypothetical protein
VVCYRCQGVLTASNTLVDGSNAEGGCNENNIDLSYIEFVALPFICSGSFCYLYRFIGGDVTGLIAAINAANSNGQDNMINLEPGVYTLTAVDNGGIGGNGLPVISRGLAITGAGRATTIIERDANAPQFGILDVVASGTLTLQRVTLRGGETVVDAGIGNSGTLTLIDCAVTGNSAVGGGGIDNGVH